MFVRFALSLMLVFLFCFGNLHRTLKSIILPGHSTHKVEYLEENFREMIDSVMGEMYAMGHHPVISTSFRSPEQQDFLYNLGQYGIVLTKVRGGGSCHNIVINGRPSSMAVDIVDGRELFHTKKEQASFYHDLRNIADQKGLRSGGHWLKKDNEWYEYDLGWDPGHLEDRRRCRKYRK